MKFEKFNKIGGTEFRVANQINGYMAFASWFVNDKDKTDTSYKTWTKQSGIYDYGLDKINRIKMILLNAERKYKVIKRVGNDFVLNFKYETAKDDILNHLTDATGLTKKTDKETCLAFKSMLDFMISNPSLNDAKKIFHAFAVYEEGDDFKDLYNKDNLFSLLSVMAIKDNQGKTAIEKCFYSKKPSQELRQVCKNILSDKENFKISPYEFDKLKHTYLVSFDNHYQFNDFVKQNNYDEIARFIFKEKTISLLNGDYFDLFNRVMWGLNLSMFAGKKVKYYLNNKIHLWNGSYSVLKHDTPIQLPYSHNVVNDYLKDIQNKNFTFMENDSHLSSLPRADIAEYFVNLKFCYLFKIKMEDIRKFVNTKLDLEFYPTNHATGFNSDMNFIKNNKLYGIETTLHTSPASIIDHEFRGSVEHLDEYHPTFNNLVLILIQWLDGEPKIVNYFTNQGNAFFKNKNKTLEFKTFDFEQLANLN